MNWYLKVWRDFAVFEGRARRTEYWMFTLFNLIIYFILCFIDYSIGMFDTELFMGVLSGLYILAVLVPGIAVAVRRLHDTGRTGWWILVSFVPFVGGLIFLVLMVLDSIPGPNKYGENPKGV